MSGFIDGGAMPQIFVAIVIGVCALVGRNLAKKHEWNQTLGCIGGGIIGILLAILGVAALLIIGNP